jgi:hypothetical protein
MFPCFLRINNKEDFDNVQKLLITCVDMSNRKEYNHFYWNYLHAPNFMRIFSLYYQGMTGGII